MSLFRDIFDNLRYYLNKEWERNRESLMRYLQEVHRGVRGLVTTRGQVNSQSQTSDNTH